MSLMKPAGLTSIDLHPLLPVPEQVVAHRLPGPAQDLSHPVQGVLTPAGDLC